MKKTLIFAMGVLALLVFFANFACADSIAFSFVGVNSTGPVGLNSTGVSLGPAVLTTITDSKSNNIFVVPGSVLVSTGAATMYTASGGVLLANFGPGTGTEVEVDSASCVGGLHPGVCLLGSQNGMGVSGFYVAFNGGTGAFQSSFHVDYVSPFVTSLFGDPNFWQQPGSDSFITSNNNFANGGTTDSAILGNGGIIFQAVPEPGTMVLLGTGLLGIAGLARHRRKK